MKTVILAGSDNALPFACALALNSEADPAVPCRPRWIHQNFGAALGAATVTVAAGRAAGTVTPGTAVADTLTPGTATNFYQFNANAGDLYYFDRLTATSTNCGGG